jgi:hypothetical protein
MTPRLRKLTLTAHVVSSVGWLGAVAAFLALAVAGLTSHDAQMVRAAYLAMDLTTRFVIVPLALAALFTGLVQSLGTPWGLFRHYWVLFKLLLTVLAVLVLLQQPARISNLAGVASQTTLGTADLRFLRTSLVVHAAVGLVVLLVVAGLGVYKPRGLTPYGMRQQRELDDTGLGPGFELTTSTPRWAKVVWAIVVILVLLIGFMMLGGGHGPGAHSR